MQSIYRALDERFWDSEGTYIKQAFNQEGLIRVKGAHDGWFKPSELSWRSNGPFLDSLYPPIQTLYRDFNKFFVDRLGISRELPTEKAVEALTRLGELENFDERKAEALAIYRRANRDLGPKFGRDVQVPDWVETFRFEAVFINQRGETVINDEYLFANDAPELAALFEDDEDLSFLAVPPVEVPRLSKLLDAAEVSRLSESITLEVSNSDESGVVNQDLTARIRRSVHFFSRVLYSKQPEAFEQAMNEGLFARLRKLEVVEVPEVDVVASLGDYSRKTTMDVALSDDRVLYRTGVRSLKDLLAAELSKFLGTSSDFADTFARILMESDVDGIEDFLRVRNISALPADLLAALDGTAEPHSAEGNVDDTDIVSVEQANTQPEVSPENESTILPEDGVQGVSFGDESRASSPPSSTTAPILSKKTDMHGGVTGVRESGSAKAKQVGSTGAPAPAEAKSKPPIALVSSSSSSPVSATHHQEVGDGSSTVLSEQDGTAVLEIPTQMPSGEFSSSQPSGSGGKYSSMNSFPISRQSRRGKSQPSRTKSGRLLSYVVGPGEADKLNPTDDPAKAAAREATGRAAVEYFMLTQAGRWKSLTEMPHNNPGFDVKAIGEDGQEEYIEVKGQGAAWTEEGVALTPNELLTAHQMGDRYWLCVVEYAQDDKRRQLHLLRNPFGLTHQFRFDVGWKSTAETAATVPLKPEKNLYIDMPGVGRGRIMSVRGKGRFFNLHVLLDDGRQVNKPFNPAKMTLSKDQLWQG